MTVTGKHSFHKFFENLGAEIDNYLNPCYY